MSLELGGKNRGLPFKIGTLRQLKGLIEGDPFDFLSAKVSGDLDEQIEVVALIAYASLLANAKTKKEDPDFTKQDVQDWMDDLDFEQVVNILNFFKRAYIGEPSGEEGAHTRTQAAEVAGS